MVSMSRPQSQQGWGPQASDEGIAHTKTAEAKRVLFGYTGPSCFQRATCTTTILFSFHESTISARTKKSTPPFGTAAHWLRLAG